jgi:hypothetical protein
MRVPEPLCVVVDTHDGPGNTIVWGPMERHEAQSLANEIEGTWGWASRQKAEPPVLPVRVAEVVELVPRPTEVRRFVTVEDVMNPRQRLVRERDEMELESYLADSGTPVKESVYMKIFEVRYRGSIKNQVRAEWEWVE